MKTLYKNLSRKKKKLYRMAYDLGLGHFEWTASMILLEIHGMEKAENYLRKCYEKDNS